MSKKIPAKKIPAKKIPAVERKPKQFLLMIDEINMSFMAKIIPGMKYIEVEGMNVEGNVGHQFLVNPNPPKTEEKPTE